MIIRKFRKEDATEIHRIIKECFQSLDLGKHTKEGIAIQIKNNSPKNLLERSKKINYYIAETNRKPVEICGYDQTKIHTLFIDLNYQRKGVGKKLLLKILKEVKSKGIKKLITWSTFYAYPFYTKFGFTGFREIKLPEGKDDIILIEMEKRLN